MNIYHDLELMTEIALQKAREHNCNYNIILFNPDENGEFSAERGSTYEMVADSYFEKPRPNVKLITTTGEIMLQEAREAIENGLVSMETDGYDIHELMDPKFLDFETSPFAKQMMAGMPQRIPQYVRAERKIGNNEPCPCGSGSKYKKCCK
jgi:SEC-C motif